MSRLHEVSRTDPEADASVVRRMYDMLFGDRDPVADPGTDDGTRGDWWTTFANVPDAMDHAVRGFVFYRSPDRVLDPVLRELAQARVGYATGSDFVSSQHRKALLALGVDREQADAVASWEHAAELFSPLQRDVLAFADCLVRDHGDVPDDLFGRLYAALGDKATLELTYIASMYFMHAVISRALRLESDGVVDA